MKFIANYCLQKELTEPNEDNYIEKFDIYKRGGSPKCVFYLQDGLSYKQNCTLERTFNAMFSNWTLHIYWDTNYNKVVDAVEEIMANEHVSRPTAEKLRHDRESEIFHQRFLKELAEFLEKNPDYTRDEAHDIVMTEMLEADYAETARQQSIGMCLAHGDVAGARLAGWSDDRDPYKWEA